MLSACIKGCNNKDEELTCLSCGRTQEERVLWKDAPDEERPELFFKLVETARDRMPEEKFRLWSALYTQKISNEPKAIDVTDYVFSLSHSDSPLFQEQGQRVSPLLTETCIPTIWWDEQND